MWRGHFKENGREKGFKMSRLATGSAVSYNYFSPSSPFLSGLSADILRSIRGVLAESSSARISLVLNVKCHLTGPAIINSHRSWTDTLGIGSRALNISLTSKHSAGKPFSVGRSNLVLSLTMFLRSHSSWWYRYWPKIILRIGN